MHGQSIRGHASSKRGGADATRVELQNAAGGDDDDARGGWFVLVATLLL